MYEFNLIYKIRDLVKKHTVESHLLLHVVIAQTLTITPDYV